MMYFHAWGVLIHTYMYMFFDTTYIHTYIHTYKHTVHCTYTHTYKHIFEPGSVHVGTVTVPHTIVFIKSNPPPHGVHDALWLFKDLLLHKVVIATCGGRDTENGVTSLDREVERWNDTGGSRPLMVDHKTTYLS